MSEARPQPAPGPQQGGDTPPHRYSAALAKTIEDRWQTFWRDDKTFYTPNPGEPGFDAKRPKQYILDMFPYPSGVGLHVGHPLGYIATDIYARYLRMAGHNVLHTMGFDAFGLPAEQFALQTGTHPRVSTEANIATMRTQLERLGLGHDRHRSVSTTDPEFYKWTQWIFLQIYNSWYDQEEGNEERRNAETKGRARPISELLKALESGRVRTRSGRSWSGLSDDEKRDEIDAHRLAYLAEVPVNWCPMLGTVLANEEVTAEGRSERGNFPVYKRPLRQWMMRITAYAQRLLEDLEKVDWPEPIKLMQRNWIGRSEGAWIDFYATPQTPIRVFTTRPDTIFGATYMVLSPEHPLVDKLVPAAWDSTQTRKGPIPEEWRGAFPGAPKVGFANPREAVEAYRAFARKRTDAQRTEAKDKTGVFTGAYATNPATGGQIPIFIADYVLMGYGTGAIMAVPAHDDRDFEFARAMNLPIRDVVYPRDVSAMRYYAQSAFPVGAPAPIKWKEQLADFLGLVSVSGEDDPFDVILTVVRERRQPEQPDGGAKRGQIQKLWLDRVQKLDIQSIEELRSLFMGAAFYKKQGAPFAGEGISANSSGPFFSLTGLTTPEAKKQVSEAVESRGQGAGACTYKLRDWLFSRQRYWGEPFPIVYDQEGHAHALPESMLPLLLPELTDFHPETSDDPDAPVRTPLNRAKDWVSVTLDLGDGGGPRPYTRETNTMPNWAGSCWYYLRYLDPGNAKAFCDPAVERYWMAGRSALRADRATDNVAGSWHTGRSLDAITESTSFRIIEFQPRDPYPQGTYGPVQDLEAKWRHLPHYDLPGATYFVTWRTKGRQLSEADRDRVVSALTHFDGQKCRSYAFCVMPDHVHWIVRPFEGASLADLVASVKRFSATEINHSHGERGSLWQEDRFDHIVRDGGWFVKFLLYVIRNAVEAGLVKAPSEYRWTRVHRDVEPDTEGLGSAATHGRLGEPTYPIGGVDLYVGGVEHAVLHLLYARFWHKVLFDLGHVSTPEPFQKLFNQGYIQAAAYTDERGMYVEAHEVKERGGRFFHKADEVKREFGKMGKSLKNAVSPDEVFDEFGCDTMRVYEMAMGPLEASKPWNTRDIAGSHRFLQRLWRNLIDESTGQSRCVTGEADRVTRRILHKTIIGVRRDMESLSFNTVVSKLIELNNHLATLPAVPLEVAAPTILMVAPLAPHIGEELWFRVVRLPQHPQAVARSVIHERFPIADERLAADDQIEVPVSINGKLRSRVSVPAGADAATLEEAAKADVRVQELIAGKQIKKTIVVPGKMVNFVVV